MTVNKVLLTEYENRLAQADAALQDKLKRVEEAEPVLKEKESELEVIEEQITLKFAQLMEPEKPLEKTFNVLFDDGSTGIFSEAELGSVETIPKEQFDTLTAILSGDKSSDSIEHPKLIILVSPHAELVSTGKKTLIVKSRDYSGECEKILGFCAGSLVFGTLKMKLPRKVPKSELDELYPLHRVTPEEIEKWWPDVKEFYLYDIYDISPYDSPRHVDIPPGPQTFVKNYKFIEGGKSEQDADTHLVYPDESKKYKGMVHIHGRGKSVHGDVRFQISEEWAIGWTLYIPKGLSKTPESFAEFKRLVDAEIMPIIKEKLSDPTKKFNCSPKKREPIEWLKYEGMVEKGGIGATKHEAGFFYIIDSFDVEYGCSKSYYHEIFTENAKLFKGRITFRLLENKEEWKQTGEGLMTWMMGKSKSQIPYTITTRAVKKKWVPPFEASALPRNIRNKVPEKYAYWKIKDTRKRRELRDELVEEIKKKQVKLDAISQGDAEFKFIKQTWRGQKVIREGPSRTLYYVILKQDKSYFSLALNTSLLSSETAAGLPFSHPIPLWIAKGEIEPGTKLNPTKATPSKIEVLDQGKATVLIEDKVKKFILKGKKIKGVWIAFQQEGSNLWTIQKSESPNRKG